MLTSRCQDCDSFSKLLDCNRVVCVIDVRYDVHISHGCTSGVIGDAVAFTFYVSVCFV